MIEKVITYLNNSLAEIGLFSKRYGLAEQVTSTDEKMYPRFYLGKGKFKDITSVSNWLGTSYFRKDGNVSIEKDSINFKACHIPLIVTYPLIFVCTVKRSNVEDDAYTDERIAGILVKTLTDENPAFKSEINAKKLTIFVEEYETDRIKITEEEFKNLDVKINYGYSYLSLKITVQISIDKNCLDDLCDGVLITNELDPIATNEGFNFKV